MQYSTTHVQKSAHCTSPPAQNFEQSAGDVCPSLSVSDSERWWPDSAKYPSSGEQAIESPDYRLQSEPFRLSGDVCAFGGGVPNSNTGPNFQTPAPAGFGAHVDWLTFTVSGSEFCWDLSIARRFVQRFSNDLMSIGGRLAKGHNGYPECYELVCCDGGSKEGLNLGWVGVSYHGDSQRGRWCFNITGVGCVLVGEDGMRYLAMRGPTMDARITRCDCAIDDYAGVHSYDWAVAQYEGGAFKNPKGGVNPASVKHEHSDARGNTIDVGSRKGSKMCRVYEKGRQLGDPNSPWVRYEGEFKAKRRDLGWAMLMFPGEYLEAAYPVAMAWWSAAKEGAKEIVEQAKETLRIVREKGRITIGKLLKHGQQQVGRLVNYMRDVMKMDHSEIVESLAGRPGRYPVRLMESVVVERLRV